MPINDPIRGKKVAPKSLAFETGRLSRQQGAGSYQTSVVNEYNVTNNYYADPREARKLDQAQSASIWNAERRAKHQTAQFGDVVQWDISATSTLDLGTWSNIPFNNEILRCMGARYGTNGWRHKVVKGDQGVWEYYAHIQITMPIGANCSEAKLGLWRNGSLVYVVDALDAGMAGETPIIDVVLSGGALVNLERGDYVEFQLYTTIIGAPGSQSFSFPTSIGGYVYGHRVKCNQSFEGATSTLDGYNFT